MFLRQCISLNGLNFGFIIFIAATALLMPGMALALETLSLEQAVQQAVQENPGLAGKRAHAQAIGELPAQAGALPDPRLSFGAVNVPVDTYNLDQEPMTQLQIGLSQEFPFFGKRKLREQTAIHEAQAAAHEVDEARLKLIRDVKRIWWELFFLDRSLEIVQRNRTLLKQFVNIAETKYKVGRGLQQDVLLAQLELSGLMDTEIRLQGRRRGQEAGLNSLLNRPPEIAISLPGTPSEQLPEPIPEAKLQQMAVDARPLIQARHGLVKAARKRLDLARKEYKPNLTVGAAYGFRDGTNADGSERPDFATLRLSLNLPLYKGVKQDKRLAQRAHELTEQDLVLQDTRQKVMAEISQYQAKYIQSRSQAELFKFGIIPQASQTVASMLAAYQVNKVDFLNLVRTQLTLYNYEIQYWQALSEANQALAALTAAVGKEEIYE